uniref:Peptidase S1 domain-containing protein n=2 Tax=Cyprinodon variegatus TaxID=28743 RepID=A0A3Q2DHJ2_CYPVA
MALQQFACGIIVMIVFLSRGINTQHACARSPINSRILGGQDASPGAWPWHVTLTHRGGVFCQGSLITDQWVLTAAHCSIRSYLSGAVLHLGANNQSRYGEETRRVDSIVCHQDYEAYYSVGDNDICLVKLSAPVNFTDYIQPVCLASEDSTFYDGTASWVTGFGTNEHYYYPDTFQEVDVSVFGNNKCSCFYRNSYYYWNNLHSITEKMMCAGSENGSKTAYYDDNGAALVTKKDSTWVQSGIVSYVYDYYLGRPTIYTRVSQYQKWISDRVTGMEPGFVTFISPGNDTDLNFTCPTLPPTTTTPYPYFTHYYNFTTDDSIFASGKALVPITHSFSLSVLVLLLHVFFGGARI